MAPLAGTHYPVVLATYISLQRGPEAEHHAIFIAVSGDGKRGTLFHVIGSLQQGMKYEARRDCPDPAVSVEIREVHHIGWVRRGTVDEVDRVCQTVAPPEKQFSLARRLNPDRPIRHCQHWVAEVIAALRTEGILEEGEAPVKTAPTDR
ncbi:hypothetical protein OQA88_9427 [Cercophora sp. LCS_1]